MWQVIRKPSPMIENRLAKACPAAVRGGVSKVQQDTEARSRYKFKT